MLSDMTDLLIPLDRWDVQDFDPNDLAPRHYTDENGDADPDHSCDGAGDSELRLRAATSAAARGWGPGWPNCQYDKWRTLVRDDGVKLPLRLEIVELTAILCDQTEILGYDLKSGWCWGAACRAIRGSNSPSNHSWALAVDLNAPENPMGPRNGAIRRHPQAIALWKRYGWRWGGDYTGRADDMHMEFMGTPDQAKAYTIKARKEFAVPDAKEIATAVVDEIEKRARGSFDRENPLHDMWKNTVEKIGPKYVEAGDVQKRMTKAIAEHPGSVLTFKPDGKIATIDGQPV